MYLSALSLALNRPGAVSLEQVVASLFANNEQGAWYDPSAANVTWRRNLLTYTEQFDNAAWTKTGIKAFGSGSTADAILSPGGTTTADLLTQDGSTGQHKAQSATLTSPGAGEPFVVSCYAKAGTSTRVCLYMYGTSKGLGVDLSTGQQFSVVGLTNVQAANAFIEAVPGYAGWYRIGFKDVMAASVSAALFVVGGANNNDFSYAGDNSSGLYIWGVQLERGTTATAYQRIITPEITYLSTVQAQPLLFQNAEGTLPVTEVEQPVGLMLDRRKGLALGPELVPDVSFDDSGAWTVQTSDWSVSGGKATYTDPGGGVQYIQSNANISLLANKWYELRYTLSGIASGDALFAVFDKAAATNYFGGYVSHTENREYVRRILVPSNANGFRIYGNGGGAATLWSIDSFSVKLLDGNHAYQTGSTARPVLRARYNLLTYSEQFNNAAWNANYNVTVTANDTTAPDGTSTADKIAETASTFYTNCGQTHVAVATEYTFSVYAKKGSSATKANVFRVRNNTSAVNLVSARVNYDTGAVTYLVGSTGVTATAVGDWWRIAITVSTGITIGNTLVFYAAFGGADAAAGTDFAYLWGADLRVGTSAGDYQRIAAATDYATTSTITGQPFKTYLLFDGADILQTASVDFTGSDAVAACIGEQQAGTFAITEVGFELSGGSSSGTFTYFSANPDPYFRSHGGAQSNAIAPSSTSYARVVSAQADISDDLCVLRVNGVEVASSTADQGAASSYVNQPLYVGARSGPAVGMSGNMYGLIIRGGPSTVATLQTFETFMASKSGVTL